VTRSVKDYESLRVPRLNRALTATVGIAAMLATVAWTTLHTRAQFAPGPAALPGILTDGTTLLPNGWRLQPAGKHLKIGDMPLNLMQTPDSKYLIVTNNGLARPSR